MMRIISALRTLRVHEALRSRSPIERGYSLALLVDLLVDKALIVRQIELVRLDQLLGQRHLSVNN